MNTITLPIEEARAVYSREKCARTFDEDLALHMRNGYVFVTPDVFIMGRPVLKDAPYSLITNPEIVFEKPDCWLVYLGAGKLDLFFKYMPYFLPWMAWERKNKLRYKETAHVERVICEMT